MWPRRLLLHTPTETARYQEAYQDDHRYAERNRTRTRNATYDDAYITRTPTRTPTRTRSYRARCLRTPAYTYVNAHTHGDAYQDAY